MKINWSHEKHQILTRELNQGVIGVCCVCWSVKANDTKDHSKECAKGGNNRRQVYGSICSLLSRNHQKSCATFFWLVIPLSLRWKVFESKWFRWRNAHINHYLFESFASVHWFYTLTWTKRRPTDKLKSKPFFTIELLSNLFCCSNILNYCASHVFVR